MNNIQLIHGDITKASADAIVNAANSRMLGGGGVDGAIHRAAGPELLKACEKYPVIEGIRCPIGEARITPGFELNSTWIIHAVGPHYYNNENPQILLRSAFKTSLTLAKHYSCRSIAFPAISCGVFEYPIKEAGEIALNTCSSVEWQDMEIRFYLFDDKVYDAWRVIFNS